MTRPGIERRRATRAKAEFSIQLAERGSMREAKLKDLSSNGLACLCAEPMREMTLVRIAVKLPGKAQSHDVTGAVVRCEKLRDVTPPTYEIAVYFTAIDNDTRAAFAEFVTSSVAV